MDKEKQIIYKTFKFVVEFLDSHNIDYFMADGSALGAVRHKGFIPWDDDIDIYMLRSEYNKLISFSEELYSKGYKLVNLGNTNNYYLRFSKIVDANTTLWEVKQYPCLLGAFIDIFPLDYCDKGIISCNGMHSRYNEIYNKYLAYIEHHSLSDYFDAMMHGRLFDIAEWIYRICTYYKKQKILGEMLEHEASLNDHKGPLLVNNTEWGVYAYPKEWFSNYIMMPFEDLQVKLPVGYHEYLTYMYGDYMKLPPEENRVSNHYHYYSNSEEGLDINEVKKRIRKGEYLK